MRGFVRPVVTTMQMTPSGGEAERRLPRPVEVALGVAVCAMLLVALLGALRLLPTGAAPDVALAAAILIAGGLLGAVAARQRLPVAVLLAALLALLLRGLGAGWLQTAPVSDFASYHAFATVLATEHRPAFELIYTQELGYPLVLGLAYLLATPSLAAGMALNLVCSAATVVLGACFARRLGGGRVASHAAVILALCPASILFSSVLASEHLYTALLWGGLFLALKGMVDANPLLAGAGGLVLGVSNAVRPTSIIALAVCVILGAVFVARRRGAVLAVLVLGFVASVGAYSSWRVLSGDRPGRSALGVSVLFGTNRASRGMWNLQDSELFGRWAEAHGFEQAQKEAIRTGLGRIAEAGLGNALFAGKKTASMWGDGQFGTYWAMPEKADEGPLWKRARSVFRGLEQVFHVVLLLGALAGAVRALRTGMTAWSAAAAGVLLASGVMHAVLESQARYQVPWMVAVVLFAAVGLSATRSGRPESRPLLAPGRTNE